MPFAIEVDCRPGPGGEPTPHALRHGSTVVTVRELTDHWPGPDHHCYKLFCEDGATYVVRHDLPTGRWALTYYDSGLGTG